MLTLRPHQAKIVAEAPDKHFLFLKMRTGKTPTSIRLAASRAKTCLVLCPKSIRNQWIKEIERWNNSDCKFDVLTKENFKKLWKGLPAYECLLIDEVHLGWSLYSNQQFKSLMGYKKKHNPRFIYGLTGTPLGSSSWNIYTMGLIIDKQWDWMKWRREFFYDVQIGHRRIPQPKKGKEEMLKKIIHSIGTVISLEDVSEVPEDVETIEYFSLNKEQKQLIKDNFNPLPVVQYGFEHQAEQGCKKSDGYTEDVILQIDKDQRITELVEQNEKVVIICRYLLQIKKIKKNLEKLNRPIYEIHGSIKQSAGDIALKAEQDLNAIVIIQSETSCGYSLRSFNTMIFASKSFSYTHFEQMCSRMKAMDKKEPCEYIHLITEGDSLDQAVHDAITKKQDFSIDLFSHK